MREKLEIWTVHGKTPPFHTWSTSASWRLLAALSWVKRDLRSSLEQGSEPGAGTCKGGGQEVGNGAGTCRGRGHAVKVG